MHIEQKLKRLAEITRMFVMYGAATCEERIEGYLDILEPISDAYFRDAIDHAMRSNSSGFAPTVGEIFASYRALESARISAATRIASGNAAKQIAARREDEQKIVLEMKEFSARRNAERERVRIDAEEAER